MDIFNRIPTISEDTLQYNLYPPPSLSDKASVTTYAACIRAYIDTLLPDFIWHRDAFEVKVIANPDPAGDGWIMEGRMRVGDCVDDEWCAVWLLKEISTKWDLVICVFDTDGEFLLIEAAEVLPPWVQPNNTENRVWIYSSHLHLIPLTHISPPSSKYHHRILPGAQDGERVFDDQSDESPYFLSAEGAVKLVRDSLCDTAAPSEVENCVWQRISRYPAATRNHMHITKAYIPSDIARSLIKYPLLIQKAVETFYTRDAIQLRSAHRMSRFPPDSSVLRSVKMTRTAYAQLVGQKFFPPKVFGNWNENENTDEWRWRDVGMKIAVGFEILYQENKGRTEILNPAAGVMNSTVESRKNAARRDPEYAKYIENLVSVGYFQGEVKGSALWSVLEGKAADIFIDVRGDQNVKRMSFASQINAATSEYTLLPASMTQEDSTDWLNVDVDEFEATLERTMGQRRPDEMDTEQSKNDFEERLATEQASKLKDLATKVEDFVGGEGDLEGARFADEEFSDGSMSDDGLDSDSENEDDQATTAARQAAMDNLVPSLEPSEYGKMPASYHGNSQRVAPITIDSEEVGGKLGPRDIGEANLQSPPKVKPVRKPLIPRDHYDGVDSDDGTDEEDMERDDEEDEDRPQVVGDVEIDMEEEEEEFLEFSRQALGISESQWNDIVQDRQQRGAFVPSSAVTRIPTGGSMPAQQKRDNPIDTRKVRTPAPGPRPNVNPNLDSFEAVMRAMDAELARVKSSTKSFAPAQDPPPAVGKGKQKATVEDEEDDTELDMDAELRAALATDDGPEEDENDEPMDYNLIKNFLESYKSQAGLSGPVGNLAGRLQPGWKIPRDIS
ncbi:SGT1-domain-containing protein [Collybia nuda]|uniref:SGT1-domain-containing protein n=1 Tax=Collybia nuda TaxID=64659 RepID=A0A9P6CBD6_9AGAR|nr:SGT1-domain-containing protein [Collybia nuda]